MVRAENPKLGAGRVVDQMAPWESFQVLGPHSGVNVCDTNSIKRSVQLHHVQCITGSLIRAILCGSTRTNV